MAGPFGLSRDQRRRRPSTSAGPTHRSTTATARSRSTRSGCRTGPRRCRHRDGADRRGATRGRDRPERGDRGLARAGRAQLADRLAAAIDEARAIERRLPEPTLALAIADGTGEDEHIHIRGSHKNLGEVVPRRFLEVLGGSDSIDSRRGQRPARAGAADGRPGGQSPDASRAGQPALEASFRRRDRQDRPTTSARWGESPAIPSCSTGWPPSWSAAAGRSRRCTG